MKDKTICMPATNHYDAIIDPTLRAVPRMNVETLATILIVAAAAALLTRLLNGFTLAGLLVSYLLACLGAIGGWFAQQRLPLPPLYTIPFPGDRAAVPVVWPALGALLVALLGGRLWRPARRPRRFRR